MSQRSYNQVCPIAYALDVIGDRWTLLIARELQFGPRRYIDLQRTLPGVATNLLADRIRHLVGAGLARKISLPPPSAVDVYELTPSGRDLRTILDALTHFGLRYLKIPPPEGAYFGVTPVMSAMRMAFNPQQAQELQLSGQIWAAGEIFFTVIEGGAFEVGYGTAHQPIFEIESDPLTLLRLVGRSLTTGDALATGDIVLRDGTPEHVKALFSVFHALNPS